MSLQEEVIRIMTDPLCSVEHRADKIVSKILDAALESVPDGMNGGNYEQDDYEGGWNHALNAFEEVINKLRPES